MDWNSRSRAPDAVGHAWTRTHARENVRTYVSMSDIMSEFMLERMPDRMSEYMQERMSDRMSEYMAYILPDGMSETM